VALLRKARLAAAAPEACGTKVTVKGTDWPTARVAGREIPLRTNSALVLAPEEIVTGEPIALNVPVMDALDPGLTLPKFSALGASVNWPDAVSLPERAMFNCEFDALERIARVPVTGPEAAGVKTTLNVRLCPAPIFAGNDNPLALNAALDMPTCEIVTLLVPVLVRVSGKIWELPGGRLPKLRLADEAAIWPAAEIPEPVNATLVVVVEAYPHLRWWCLQGCPAALTDTEPLSVPTAAGLKVMSRRALCPGERVNPLVGPLTAKPLPLAPTLETLRAEVPVLVMLTACVWLFPTSTLPKPKAEGAATICCVWANDGRRARKTETKRKGAQGLTKPKLVTVHTYAYAR
jgi:hypothetical protein